MFSQLTPLSPAAFFAFEVRAKRYKGRKLQALGEEYLLEDLSAFTGGVPFGRLYVGWHEKGLYVTCRVKRAYTKSAHPFQEGEALELFVDTRGSESERLTPYCHHFFFVPEEVEGGERCGELTKLRGEQARPLAEASKLEVQFVKGWRDFALHLFLPQEVLHGYDPLAFPRLRFSYRLYHPGRGVQCYGATDAECALEQFPAFWPHLQLRAS